MNSEVKEFLRDLKHSRKREIADLTTKIATSFPRFESEIKWNAPSFKSKGENILTFQLFPDPAFRVILHLGSKKIVNPPDLRFEISQLKHKWADSTRCVINVDEELNFQALNRVIKEWVKDDAEYFTGRTLNISQNNSPAYIHRSHQDSCSISDK